MADKRQMRLRKAHLPSPVPSPNRQTLYPYTIYRTPATFHIIVYIILLKTADPCFQHYCT